MEIRNGVTEQGGIEICQGFLETPERLACVANYHGVLGRVIGHRVHVLVHSPERGAVLKVVLAVTGIDVSEALDVRVVLCHELCDQRYVVHDIPGLSEDICVDLLDYVGVHPAVNQEVRPACVVDFALVDLADIHKTRKIELA